MARGTATARTGVRGTVTDFDQRRGLGEVTSTGGEVHPFHATAVADGSRDIAVGTPVSFDVVAGRLGRWEADRITPLS